MDDVTTVTAEYELVWSFGLPELVVVMALAALATPVAAFIVWWSLRRWPSKRSG